MTSLRRVVLVTGSERSGATSVAAALRERMADTVVVEAGGLSAADTPEAVVLVASAAAPMTASECANGDAAAASVDVVVGAVAKIDAHRGWRDVLAADRTALAGWSPRYRSIPWVGVAAAPDVGEPNVGELVAELSRNDVRTKESGERSMRAERIGRLRACRSAAIRDHRSARAERSIALRSELHRQRVELNQFVRRRCADLRAQFRAAAAAVPRGGTGAFEAALRREAGAVLAELDERIALGLGEVAGSPAAGPELPGPTLTARGAESRLTVALGAGFGLGVAVAVGRVVAGLVPGLTVPALAVGGLAGLALTVWLVMTRALLGDRAALDRWVTDSVTTLRWHAEDVVTGALLAAEVDRKAKLAGRDDAESSAVAKRIGVIDDELGALVRQAAVENE